MKKSVGLFIIMGIMLSLASRGYSKTPQKLEQQLLSVTTQFHGDMGISFHHLKTGDTIEINSDTRFPTASTIKLPILCTAFQQLSEGKLGYYDTHPYSTSRRVGGAGFLQNYQDGIPVELKETIHFMITVSDNNATNMMIDWVGGFENINRWLINHGFQKTRSLTYIGGGKAWDRALANEWGIGVTTPQEMRTLAEMIRLNKAGSPAACDRMQRLMTHQYFDDMMPAEIPPFVHQGSKSGAVNASRSEVMITDTPSGTYILCVYTKNNKDQRWTNENEAEIAIKDISQRVWKYYHPASTWSRPIGTEDY